MKEEGGGGEGKKRLQTNPSILKICVENPGVCLQAFPSFLPHPLPAYSRHFSRGLCSKTAALISIPQNDMTSFAIFGRHLRRVVDTCLE